ncbi:MAG: hypothetical protein IBJ10_04565 [Phycisphaerales bacterium]|nr:hypothetical protein [Phycisphaerales bacterium]
MYLLTEKGRTPPETVQCPECALIVHTPTYLAAFPEAERHIMGAWESPPIPDSRRLRALHWRRVLTNPPAGLIIAAVAIACLLSLIDALSRWRLSAWVPLDIRYIWWVLPLPVVAALATLASHACVRRRFTLTRKCPRCGRTLAPRGAPLPELATCAACGLHVNRTSYLKAFQNADWPLESAQPDAARIGTTSDVDP